MSAAGNSYEAWKESLRQAEAAGVEDWSEAGEAEPITSCGLGPGELKGICGGLLIGLGLLLGSALLLLPNYKHFTRGERTVGIVVGHQDYYQRASASGVLAPVVNYSAPGGVFRVAGGLSVASRHYPVGKEVTVLYLRDNPRNAVVFDFVQMFLIPSVVGGLGLICLFGTAGVALWITRSELPATAAALGTGPTNAPPAIEEGEKAKPIWQPPAPAPAHAAASLSEHESAPPAAPTGQVQIECGRW